MSGLCDSFGHVDRIDLRSLRVVEPSDLHPEGPDQPPLVKDLNWDCGLSQRTIFMSLIDSTRTDDLLRGNNTAAVVDFIIRSRACSLLRRWGMPWSKASDETFPVLQVMNFQTVS